MTIREITRHGLHHAWTCKWLWFFGFFVGASGGGNLTYSNRGEGGAPGGMPFGLTGAELALMVAAIALAAIVAFVLRFLSEGALIEGIVRARAGRTMTIREGFGAGWTHWGVLVRIALLYLAAVFASLAVVAAPCVIAFFTFGPIGGIAVTIPALVVAVPWLVTLFLVQAFASRIAVLENRHALDAIGKGRLFLHGRLLHGLRLIVATVVGTLAIVLPGLVAIVPVVLLLVASIPLVGVVPVAVVGCLVLVPVLCVLTAMSGTLKSSIWTIGYLTQVES
jgi:hypothetical protein